MRVFWTVALAWCWLACIFSAAHAERRVALVIGNGGYTAVPALSNPPNDARDVGATLKGLGFDVETVIDADNAALDRAVQAFGRRANGAAIALLFYSGHGMQVDGENYLLPV